jgi:hypothetical protein
LTHLKWSIDFDDELGAALRVVKPLNKSIELENDVGIRNA